MSFGRHPKAFRLRNVADTPFNPHQKRGTSFDAQTSFATAAMNTTLHRLLDGAIASTTPPHGNHPNFLSLAGLVCEAVLEVIFVALPGFVVAYSGMFDAHSQKFVAELNTMVFTPCLVFTKLASQLNADKLADLVVIPFIFAAQTMVSWACAHLMARLFGFATKEKRRQKNFILAMGVFGNSNSLPISLVLSLSKTISGLHWDKIPGDNDNEVAARGILYLLIFQQLGQLLRWTWGYSVLLKPASAYEEDERRVEVQQQRYIEEGEYRDDPDDVDMNGHGKKHRAPDSGFSSGSHSPGTASILSAEDDDRPDIMPSTAANGNNISAEPRHFLRHGSPSSPRPTHGVEDGARSTGHITTFPDYSTTSPKPYPEPTSSWKKPIYLARSHLLTSYRSSTTTLSTFTNNLYRRLPPWLQRALTTFNYYNSAFWAGVWRQMNPPLWAMLIALIVASIPALQHLFFDPGTLVNNSLTRAVQQSGNVAVPLILVVLGANLARSTLPQDQLASTPEETAEERKLLYASLLSRMVFPTIIMAPVLALVAKFVPISILDDPIFIIVCFLLTGAPSALQLAQICQLNDVFMGAMSALLTASYVVAIFPSTLVLVMLALEVLEWAQPV
ncbi:auxin efflux carrier [Teratosphaeria nubilosa]|uniref:Auxin efflux carrier n=1 Tax=Teratosphaeria nubilosa TaxID=161662 RepID=A0A6G1KU43_9PEZI|nr:auxin efflux carrier [Teratosphaeria nubilosa]